VVTTGGPGELVRAARAWAVRPGRVRIRGAGGGKDPLVEESGPSGGDRGNPLPIRTTVVALAASGPPRLLATTRAQGELPGWLFVGFRSSGVPRSPTATTLGPCQQGRQSKSCPLCAMSSRGQFRLSRAPARTRPRAAAVSTTATTQGGDPADPGPGRRRQSQIFGDGARGRRLQEHAYGVALAGADGVRKVIDNLVARARSDHGADRRRAGRGHRS
jgi:hypothetical protein